MNLQTVAAVSDLRVLARRRLPRMVFDYIDGEAGEGITARRNTDVFERINLLPAVLEDVGQRDLGTTLFGQRLSRPLIIGPTGLNGAFWPEGDLVLARAAAALGIPFVMSTAATADLASVARVAGELRWFQLYMMKDRGLVRAFLERVHASGFHVLQLTVDTAVAGRRNRDIRNRFTLPFRWNLSNLLDCVRHPGWSLGMLRSGGPTLRLFEDIAGKPAPGATISEVMQQQLSSSFTWSDLAWLRERWPGHLVLKGVSSPGEVVRALEVGVDGVVVSNHGGRQLDGARAAIESLPAVVGAAAGRLTVLVDSGFRTGTAVAKALALGADGVQLGRSTLFGLAAAGEAGARHAVQVMTHELDIAMALCGATNPRQLRGRAEFLE